MSLKEVRAAILVGPEFEDLELFYPYYRFQEEGFEVHIIGLSKGSFKGEAWVTR